MSEPEPSKYTVKIENCKVTTNDCKCASEKCDQRETARPITIHNYGNVYFCCNGCCSSGTQEGSKCLINPAEQLVETKASKSASPFQFANPFKSERSVKTAVSFTASEGSSAGPTPNETVLTSEASTGIEGSTKLPADTVLERECNTAIGPDASQAQSSTSHVTSIYASPSTEKTQSSFSTRTAVGENGSEHRVDLQQPTVESTQKPVDENDHPDLTHAFAATTPTRILPSESSEPTKTPESLDRSVYLAPMLPLAPDSKNVAGSQDEDVKQTQGMLNELEKTPQSLDTDFVMHQKKVTLLANIDGTPVITNLTLNFKAKNKDAKFDMQELWVDGIRVFSRNQPSK